mgnify:CR=1 FL=1
MIESAVILAAGKGTRMGSLTMDTPKPMLPLAGKPMLEHILDRLRAAGIRRVLLIVGYHGDLIQTHFAQYPLAIEYRRQQVLNGTGSAALHAHDFAVGFRDGERTVPCLPSEPRIGRPLGLDPF